MCLWIQFLITLYLSFFLCIKEIGSKQTHKNATENKVYNEILHLIKSISLLLDPPYFYLYTELYPCEPKGMIFQNLSFTVTLFEIDSKTFSQEEWPLKN